MAPTKATAHATTQAATQSATKEEAQAAAQEIAEAPRPSSDQATGQTRTIDPPPNARLEVGEQTLALATVPASQGHHGMVISPLMNTTGLVALDPGFANTAPCTSEITFIDGDQGILRYRGYPIEQLAKDSTFLEVALLLIRGELPSAHELEAFETRIDKHMYLSDDFRQIFSVMPRRAHPMATLGAAINMMAGFYPESLDPQDPAAVSLATSLVIAKMPTIISYIYRRAQGNALLYPKHGQSYIENFARMTFQLPGERFEVPEVFYRALDSLLILHADHEQNCSTSSVRMIGSAQANLYMSVSGGVSALSGPLHGGANEAVLNMLSYIRDNELEPKEFMTRVKDKTSGMKLMGFGHRVYKSYDPRAAIVKQSADAVLAALGVKDELLDIAYEVEQVALNDDYFVERRLYPNVDFYTGIIYRAMGFPSSMFTALFALGRLPGWIAQWREMISDPAGRIGRPRQVYVGSPKRDYVPINRRS
ncbi:MAG: citrate synthase [Bifidobacteriaceae bacterium]|jgi:citrate synthase|nr:citrate synthase [Bifidobacteriaceae bacterium]